MTDRKRILVVEDEAITALDLQRTLVQLGYEVPRTVATGEEAIRAADELELDLILCDIVVRGQIDGVQAAQKIREKRKIPVVFLTAYGDRATFTRARAAEPYGYLVKPFHDEELRTTLDTALLRYDLEERLRQSELHQRDFATSLMAAREEERAHLAREIHDELGQILTHMRLELTWVQRHPEPPDEVAERALALRGVVDGALVSVRRIATALRPPILDEGGLAAAIEWLCRDFTERTQVPCTPTLDWPLASQLPAPVATALFRILQEALTNVTRHAQARLVHVTLERAPEAVQLTVQDDGVGLQQPDPTRRSLGLLGMHERAAALGGTVQVVNRPGGTGLEVRVQIPLPMTELVGA